MYNAALTAYLPKVVSFMKLWQSALGQFRIISITEGLSYLLLLFIAMPLKYMWDMPQAVSIVGSLHGFLFIIFAVAWLRVWSVQQWSILKAVLAFVSSLIPFGAFVLEHYLRKEQPMSDPNLA
jgi:integral membrane protein